MGSTGVSTKQANDDEEENEDEEDPEHLVEWVGWDPTMALLKEHMQECQ